MRSKNPELMKEISAYVDAFYRANHFSPSLSEIANGVNVAKTTVYRYLVEMNERGPYLLRRTHNRVHQD